MEKDKIKEKYTEQITRIKASNDFEDFAKNMMVGALEDKMNAELRAVDQKIVRIKDKLFISHYYNGGQGCPECNHQYTPTDEEVSNALKLQEARSIKL